MSSAGTQYALFEAAEIMLVERQAPEASHWRFSDYENVGLMIYPAQEAKSPDEPTEAMTPTRNPQST